jgi:hypothetical protein
MVLTLQKLVHLHPDGEDGDSDSEDLSSIGGSPKSGRGRASKMFRNLFTRSKTKYNEKQRKASIISGVHDPANGYVTGHTDGVDAPVQKLRTLQRYHGGPNVERMAYMEARSPLTKRKLAVSAEQVSIFLTAGKYTSHTRANIARKLY